jgi:hypothetical protein
VRLVLYFLWRWWCMTETFWHWTRMEAFSQLLQ